MANNQGIPALGDRAVYDATNYPEKHANDKDASTSALHHSIGTGANQAAAGNHTHAAGGAVWGSISGTLSNQTDLNTALNACVLKVGDTMTGILQLDMSINEAILMRRYGSAQNDGTRIRVRRGRGTLEAPDSSQDGDSLGYLIFQGHSGSNPFNAAAVQGFSGSPSAGYLVFMTSDSGGTFAERVRIDKDGLVGVGTTAPKGPLSFGAAIADILSDTTDGSDTKALRINGAGGTGTSRGAEIVLKGNEYSGSGGALYLAAGNVATGSITFNTGATDRMVILNSGDIGIGMSPSYKLDVNGSIRGADYYSGDGTQGIDYSSPQLAKPGGGTLRLYFKDGLLTSTLETSP